MTINGHRDGTTDNEAAVCIAKLGLCFLPNRKIAAIVRFSSTMPLLRLCNIHLLRCSFSQLNPPATQIARFHSTPSLCEKWRNKWNSDVSKGQEPSKNHIRHSICQKRADAKKALKKLLYSSGSSNFSVQNYDSSWNFSGRSSWSADTDEHSNCFDKNFQSKPSSQFGGKSNSKKMKRKFRMECLFEDYDDEPETEFQGGFGKRWYAWCFGSSNDWFHSSSSGFQWKSRRAEAWHSDTYSKTEFDADSCVMGSSSDRSILGLPPRGPLKIEEVKKAFHLSALKWHPDKHQQPSQSMFLDCLGSMYSNGLDLPQTQKLNFDISYGGREIQALCECLQILVRCAFYGYLTGLSLNLISPILSLEEEYEALDWLRSI